MAKITRKNIAGFQDVLLEWFNDNGREFPWREPLLSDYQIIITEALLQRTKAETVAKFYANFFIEYPDWSALATAPLEVIADYLKPIGLYRQRAERLKKLAIAVVDRNEDLPKSRSGLEALPFIGQYTANAIELILYGIPRPLLDVNMSRLVERYFKKREMADIRYDPFLQDLTQRIVQLEKSKELNWAILDFAALICKARNPLCNQCPLQKNCTFFVYEKL